ncbi:MAG: peroxiredoxin-like family protein [Ktedonobacteraceae bacterium]
MSSTERSSTSTLKHEIRAFKAQFVKQIPPSASEGIDADINRQVASDITKHALQVGEHAPDFTLPDVLGKDVPLATFLAQGPVVLTFYRGEWCPYCNLQLSAYQRILPQIQELGATLVAVSPQTPDHSLSFVEKKGLTFSVLTDAGNRVARAYGLVYKLSDSLHNVYEQLGIILPEYNGDDSQELPISATYIFDQSGTIRTAFVDADFTHRLEPAAILEGIEEAKSK